MFKHELGNDAGSVATSVRGVTLHRLPQFQDLRGHLTFGEAGKQIPFEIKRYFLVYDVPGRHVRGEHAHRTLHQLLLCVRGSCRVTADDGVASEEFLLDHPSIGLHIPPMIWSAQHQYSDDAMLLVLSSDYYDSADYIRDYAEFRKLAGLI